MFSNDEIKIIVRSSKQIARIFHSISRQQKYKQGSENKTLLIYRHVLVVVLKTAITKLDFAVG
jgi:hypothetical protein